MRKLVTLAVRESDKVIVKASETNHGSRWRVLEHQGVKASMHDELHADKTSLYRSAVVWLNYWAVDRPDIQYAVRECSKSKAGQRLAKTHARCQVRGTMFV